MKRSATSVKTPIGFLNENYSLNSPPKSKIALIIHIHYREFVEPSIAAYKLFPSGTKLFITTSDREIFKKIEAEKINGLVLKLVPNIGRNFAPLLVEFSKQLLDFDIVFHLHSKKSTHTIAAKSKKWNDDLWKGLVGSKNQVNRIINILNNDGSIGVVYPGVETILKQSSFAWHLNRDQAEKWYAEIGEIMPQDPLAFPAGGMMAFRPNAIRQLLMKNWKYDDFPPELGQIDGATHHMIERLFGTLPTLNKYEHCIYVSDHDAFTKEKYYLP